MNPRVPEIVISSRNPAGSKACSEKIRNSICALLNSGGGTLEFIYNGGNLNNIADVFMKRAEQIVRDAFTISQIQAYFKMKEKTQNSFTLELQGSFSLVTLKYNIFLPTETQVLEIRPVESRSQLLNIIERKIRELPPENEVHEFINNKQSGLQESQTVQLKETFPSNLEPKDFSKYVSAFANHNGGCIYYGINDNGVVKAETISETEKSERKDKVADAVRRMTYSGETFSNNVEVDFISVGEEDKYVTVIRILPWRGGVFTAKPQSYYINNKGEVTEVEFDDWLSLFKISKQPWPITVIPDTISRLSWSTSDQREIYLQFTTELVRCRNNNDKKKFARWKKLAIETYAGSSAPLVVIAEEVVVQYKKHNFEKSGVLLKHFSKEIQQANNNQCFLEVKMLYLESRIERAKTNYQESYEIGKRFLPMRMTTVPAEFITAWFYMHLAMLANILGIRDNDPSKFSEAQCYLTLASRDICALDDILMNFADINQKIWIYRAMVLLRCSLMGHVSDEVVASDDVDRAAEELNKVSNSYLKGNIPTSYRKIQFLFGLVSLFLRRSELPGLELDGRLEYLKQAHKLVKQAEVIAHECGFTDMKRYVNTFDENLKKIRKKHEPCNNCSLL